MKGLLSKKTGAVSTAGLTEALDQLRRAAAALPAARKRHAELVSQVDAAMAGLRAADVETVIAGAGRSDGERTRLRRLRDDVDDEQVRVEALEQFLSGAGVAAVEAAADAVRVEIETRGADVRDKWRVRLASALVPVAELLREGKALETVYGVRTVEFERLSAAWATFHTAELAATVPDGALSLRGDGAGAGVDPEAAAARELIRDARLYLQRLREDLERAAYERRRASRG